MSIKSFLSNLFSAYQPNGEVEQAEQTGRNHARLVVGAYLDGFDNEASAMLAERMQRIHGHVIDVQPPALEADDDSEATAVVVSKPRRKAR